MILPIHVYPNHAQTYIGNVNTQVAARTPARLRGGAKSAVLKQSSLRCGTARGCSSHRLGVWPPSSPCVMSAGFRDARKCHLGQLSIRAKPLLTFSTAPDVRPWHGRRCHSPRCASVAGSRVAVSSLQPPVSDCRRPSSCRCPQIACEILGDKPIEERTAHI